MNSPIESDLLARGSGFDVLSSLKLLSFIPVPL